MKQFNRTFTSTMIVFLMIVFLVASALLLTATPALANGADTSIFLPLVARNADPIEVAVNASNVDSINVVPTQMSNNDFRIEPSWGMTRLQHIVENGGSYNGPSDGCGGGSKLKVYIVNSPIQGPFIIEVIHTDDAGLPEKEMGVISDEHGVTFELRESATVRIVSTAQQDNITSDIMTVSNNIQRIPFERLIGSNYCSDTASCQRIVDAKICDGSFSWNVVFTGS